MKIVWVVLMTAEDGTQTVSVCSDPTGAGGEAAAWLGEHDGEVDGYHPDLVNAAIDGDDREFVSNDRIQRVRIFKEFVS